jgi:hypothetical protein
LRRSILSSRQKKIALAFEASEAKLLFDCGLEIGKRMEGFSSRLS